MTGCHTRAEARELCERILAQTTADEAEVFLESGERWFTCFARNEVRASGSSSDVRVTIRTVYGNRSASVTLNDVSARAIERAVARSEELAQLAPPDPQRMPVLGAQQYPEVSAFYETTEQVTLEQQVETVYMVTDAAAAATTIASGQVERRSASWAVASTNGLFAYHCETRSNLITTARTVDGPSTGWAAATHNDWSSLASGREVAERAIEKARRGAPAAPLEPGTYVVILEPAAVANLLSPLVSALEAQRVDAFSQTGGAGNRLGELVADERVTLSSDPQDPDLLARPFTDDGQPLRQTHWIENGVLRNLSYSRFWAANQEAVAAPLGGGIKLSGGTSSLDDVLAGIERGVLVTRFSDVQLLDARSLRVIGTTRDGTFLVENGTITRAATDMRFDNQLLGMLNSVQAIGAPVRVIASEGGMGQPIAVPPLVIREFHFTAVSDAD